MIYSIEEHKHRFSAWAAGRAASVNGCRFSVENGKKILESAGLRDVSESVENLPLPLEFDIAHRHWRRNCISTAAELGITFTHGVSAKLINIYLKSIFVCGNDFSDPRVKAIHPPIDRVLLDTLYRNNIGRQKVEWQKARKARWSKLNSEQYEGVILAVKNSIASNEGLWEIEKYWQGFQ